MCVTVITCVAKFMLGCVIDWSYQSDHVYHMMVSVSGGTFLAYSDWPIGDNQQMSIASW